MESRLILSLNLSLLLLVPTFSREDPLKTSCTEKGRGVNYSTNSPFELNLKTLLGSLPSNTSTTGFHSGLVGSNPNEVYGQALCRGDVASHDCEICVRNASQSILHKCKTIDGIIWYELCQVRYSYSMFFSSTTYAGQYIDVEEKKTVNPVKYGADLRNLMDKLSNEAAYNASRKLFAVGQVKVVDRTMYGLVQCTRDISPGDCRSCLTQAFGDLDGCCSSLQGGTIFGVNCNMRFELHPFYNATSVNEIFISTGRRNRNLELSLAVGIPTSVLIVVAASCALYHRMRKKAQEDEEMNRNVIMSALTIPREVVVTEEGNLESTEGLPFMDLATIIVATENFSDSKKIGEGGFGAVYKGILPDGTKVAVKRLARRSWQGLKEFKNEIILIANLQHRNLVRLLGCGVEGKEKIIVYDFMPNKSLDLYIFDAEKRYQLNWETRFNIINGIARGLLYLHDGSRLRIIHRDLKPSNVLLDQDMVAKISDFGIARIFCEKQSAATTKRVVGTYGYMSPEYAMEGLFSVKSDVFSYGVIVLEIISGKRSTSYLNEHSHTLLAYAWKVLNEGKELEFVDSLLAEQYPIEEVLRCLQVALLCVQEDPVERPTMAHVVSLLNRESISFPRPSRPAVSVRKAVEYDQMLTVNSSVNEITVSTVTTR